MRLIAGAYTSPSWLNSYTSARWWAAVFGIWTLFGMLVAGYAQLRFGMGRGYASWLSTMLPFYWAWVPVTPGVVLLVSRFGFQSERRMRSLVAHLAGGVVATVVHSIVYAVILTAMTEQAWSAWGATVSRTLRRHAVGDLATYAAAAGGMLALLHYRQAQLREREAAQAAIRASRLEAQLSAARLAVLQTQLHPHFLFNALNSISVIVLKGASAEAIRAIRQLADLLRVTLGAVGTQEVPLQEEIEFVQAYLELEKLRFGDNLDVEVQLAADTVAALVPRLILQPLVENAIIHGLRPRVSSGLLRIAARRDNGTLRLEVWDNGVGLPPGGGDSTSGVGLSNTRARLQELYGETAYLRITSETGGGTCAFIGLPYHIDRSANAADTV